MNYFKTVKTNKQIRTAVSISFLVWIFFMFLGFFAFNYFYNSSLDQESVLANEHLNDELHEVTELLDNFDIYINADTLVEFDLDEFVDLAEYLYFENRGITAIAYAPSGRIDYVYPLNDPNDILGDDLFITSSVLERLELYDSITLKDCVMQFEEEQNEISHIKLFKPIYVDNDFHGFVSVVIEVDKVPTEFTAFGRDIFKLAVLTGNNKVIINPFSIDVDKAQTYDLINDDFALKYVLSPTNTFSNEIIRFIVIYVAVLSALYLLGIAYMINEMTKTHKLIEQLNYSTSYDEHIDVLNNQSLKEDIDTLIAQKKEFYFAFGSINNLKYIFNKFGHSVGQKLLYNVADKVKAVLSNNTELYRYGGDEFVFVIKTKEIFEVKNILDRVLRVFNSEVVVGKIRGNFSISLGVVKYPSHGSSVDELINKADIVMSSSKSFYKNSYRFYERKNIQSIIHNQDFDTYLSSIPIEKFDVYLMPILNSLTNEIRGFEALSRLFDKNGVLLNVPEVIGSLERSGRIQELDEYVFKMACEYKVKLDTIFDQDYFISANVSGMSFNKKYVDNIIDTYEHYDNLKNNIIVELTESYNFDDVDFLYKLFDRISKSNIKLALDDFGTGFSSLSYLSRLPLDIIKIDKSFIQGYKDNVVNRQLIQMVQNLSNILKVHVIAEGIDSVDQLNYVTSTGCKYYQGYLFSKAVHIDGIIKLIKKEKSKQKRNKK